MNNPPTLRFKVGSRVIPGDRVGNIRQIRAGKGTYIKNGHIYASLAGVLRLSETTVPMSDSDEKSQIPNYICSIELLDGGLSAASQALFPGQLVVGQVLRITPQNAVVQIRVAENVGALHASHEGAIRMEDIRSGASEQVAVGKCFQPGDLVICRVISLGDTRRYFLSTAEIELGVIRATKNGVPMIPVSWKEMECPETGAKEPRKCAKPSNLSSTS